MVRTTTAILLEVALVTFAARAPAQPPPPEPAREQRQPPPPVPADRSDTRARQEGVEPLLHGPVHEAFAAPTPGGGEPLSKVSELPPHPPEELPAPAAPDHDAHTARWIPGYWGWDAHERGYVWVSGTWRSAPPETEWVPGYWARVGSECRWVAGFWAHRGEEELTYVPPPPVPRQEQPSSPPDESHVWVPGNWQYVEEEYRWKPGFWAAGRDGWVWTPDCYAWTPRGHIFVRGYWDLPLERRGLLFAPLAMRPDSVPRVSPTIAIDIRQALVHWFVAPAYGHYFFGDYYDVPRGGGPLVSWYEYGTAGPKYDAMLAYYSGHDARFLGSLMDRHKSCKLNAAHRPALLWRDAVEAGAGELAFAISGERLPAGVAAYNFTEQEFAGVAGYYRNLLDRRAEFEHGAAIVAGSAPVFVPFNKFLPPGHGGLPPGLAKKGLVPPGHGGAPPGQTKKALGPTPGKPGKGKGGGKGKGKG